jgi:hypothetical protein
MPRSPAVFEEHGLNDRARSGAADFVGSALSLRIFRPFGNFAPVFGLETPLFRPKVEKFSDSLRTVSSNGRESVRSEPENFSLEIARIF